MELVQTSGKDLKDKKLFLDGHTEKIKRTLEEVKNSFCYVGFLLWEIQHYKYYLADGYNSLEDYALDVFGFKKSTTYNFINVCVRFSQETSFGYPSYNVKEEFKDYNFSQLCEMTSIKDKNKLNQIDPKMSVRKIKELKKEKVEESVQVEVKEVKVKEELFNFTEKKLLMFILDEYSSRFAIEYQDKFNKSKKLEKNFGVTEIDLIDVCREIREKIESSLEEEN